MLNDVRFSPIRARLHSQAVNSGDNPAIKQISHTVSRFGALLFSPNGTNGQACPKNFVVFRWN